MVLPSLALSGKSRAEFIVDVWHEWTHAAQLADGWQFHQPRSSADTHCRLVLQEGEARAMAFWLAERASDTPPWRQITSPAIDYAAVFENMHLELDAHVRQMDAGDMTFASYAIGEEQWRRSGLNPTAWRAREQASCSSSISAYRMD